MQWYFFLSRSVVHQLNFQELQTSLKLKSTFPNVDVCHSYLLIVWGIFGMVQVSAVCYWCPHSRVCLSGAVGQRGVLGDALWSAMTLGVVRSISLRKHKCFVLRTLWNKTETKQLDEHFVLRCMKFGYRSFNKHFQNSMHHSMFLNLSLEEGWNGIKYVW